MATHHSMRLARNTRVFICAIGIMVALPTGLAAQAAVPRAGIDTAAAIRVARATYQEVQRALGAHRLSRRDTTVTCHDEEPGLALMFHRDIIGVVRHFEWRGGSEDHAVRNQYFYDAAGDSDSRSSPWVPSTGPSTRNASTRRPWRGGATPQATGEGARLSGPG
jgi:hypothetical protein